MPDVRAGGRLLSTWEKCKVVGSTLGSTRTSFWPGLVIFGLSDGRSLTL